MSNKKLQEYLPAQQDRILRKLEESLTANAILAIKNCPIKNLTYPEFQDQMLSSYVGMARIPEFRFSDLTIDLLQEMGIENLYQIYSKTCVPTISTETRAKIVDLRSKLDQEGKSKLDFWIKSQADNILTTLRYVGDDNISTQDYWKVVNNNTDKVHRTKISEAVISMLTNEELIRFGIIRPKGTKEFIDIGKQVKSIPTFDKKEILIYVDKFFDWIENNKQKLIDLKKSEYEMIKYCVVNPVSHNALFKIITQMNIEGLIVTKYPSHFKNSMYFILGQIFSKEFSRKKYLKNKSDSPNRLMANPEFYQRNYKRIRKEIGRYFTDAVFDTITESQLIRGADIIEEIREAKGYPNQ